MSIQKNNIFLKNKYEMPKSKLLKKISNIRLFHTFLKMSKIGLGKG